jgi:hypothetical protein
MGEARHTFTGPPQTRGRARMEAAQQATTTPQAHLQEPQWDTRYGGGYSGYHEGGYYPTKPLKPHSPTAVAIPPRPLTSPPQPYKRHHTPPHPHPQHFAAFLIVSLGSKLIVYEKKPPLICLYVAGLPQSPHHPPKPLVSFASLPSPSFSSRSELSEPILRRELQ